MLLKPNQPSKNTLKKKKKKKSNNNNSRTNTHTHAPLKFSMISDGKSVSTLYSAKKIALQTTPFLFNFMLLKPHQPSKNTLKKYKKKKKQQQQQQNEHTHARTIEIVDDI